MQVRDLAISYRRQQLGIAPMPGHFARCCQPVCTPETIGAYRFGKRLMALDGTRQDVPDTAPNAACFARPSNQYGLGLFPQLRLLILIECGSHAAIDQNQRSGEQPLAEELMPSLCPDMFLLHDAQFTGPSFWRIVRQRRAHVMGPLPSHHLPTHLRQLSDGSYLAAYPPSKKREEAGGQSFLGA